MGGQQAVEKLRDDIKQLQNRLSMSALDSSTPQLNTSTNSSFLSLNCHSNALENQVKSFPARLSNNIKNSLCSHSGTSEARQTLSLSGVCNSSDISSK
ncbi:unnamed protein product [Protopolystoma xenopodis]|uniref:Uncharacterized protein n=1 Tax=Protopolystoma xenopodis TaxID=117903 RepID=A0A448WAJ1_9PLAT|nr:unnamed protein product [Protopolystoma xenopodis]